MEKKELVRTLYIYIFSLVGLILITIGAVRLVDLGLKAIIFTEADKVIMYPSYYTRPFPPEEEKEISLEEEERQRQEQIKYQEDEKRSRQQNAAANSLAMIIVGAPLFLYHWKIIQKERDLKKQ